ncbi:Hypp301 [Branchiostoma lanceolatum]|uniref:Hypp301 protein n=1 Tax=Branchiostoma lanceolatum TaxID=7740 RepID=A0A8J9V907_BRALA|nr:Hypp301 [Branchiostoma lanceolatum]
MTRVLAAVALILAVGLATVDAQAWSWRSHGKPGTVNIKSAMAVMKDGKLFGVGGNKKLYERVWTGSGWTWVNHGKPSSGIFNPKNFLEEPCILRDGKVYMTTIDGDLYERYWTGSQWSFGAHGNPGTNLEGCSALKDTAGRAMVFTRGHDGTLRERYWTGSSWAWRNHGKPPGTDAYGTTSSYAIYGPTTRVFVPGRNGRLFRFSLDGNYNGAWKNLGAPPGKSVRKVHATEKGGIFAITVDGDVCRWSGSWACYGKPDGKAVWDCSDPFLIENPSINIQTLFCVHTGSYQEVYQLSVFQGGSGWVNRGKPSGTNTFVDRPTVMFSGPYSRVFVPANNGKVYELYPPGQP